MPKKEQPWQRVWAAVGKRQEALGWTDAKLSERCNISQTTYSAGKLRGKAIQRADKIAGVEDGLGWARGSVAVLLAGGQPEVVDPAEGGGPSPLGDDVRRRVEALEQGLAATDLRVDIAIDEWMSELHRLVGELRDGVGRQAQP